MILKIKPVAGVLLSKEHAFHGHKNGWAGAPESRSFPMEVAPS